MNTPRPLLRKDLIETIVSWHVHGKWQPHDDGQADAIYALINDMTEAELLEVVRRSFQRRLQ